MVTPQTLLLVLVASHISFTVSSVYSSKSFHIVKGKDDVHEVFNMLNFLCIKQINNLNQVSLDGRTCQFTYR